jgi:5-methylthioribose kinase
MEKEKNYPYQNKALDDMLDEVWKDIPGFEGIYQASNLGRVKSLDREIPHPRLHKQFVKGRILSQSIAYNRNIKTGDPMVDLRVSLNKDGEQYYFNTRRIIYSVFVKDIDYDKDGLYVINADGDGFNNEVSNLNLVTKSEKSKRVFLRDRIDSYLKIADRTNWKNYGGYTRRIPVLQYSLEGAFIAQYESIKDASRKTGCGEKEIALVARGIHHKTGGFKWQYAKAVPVETLENKEA